MGFIPVENGVCVVYMRIREMVASNVFRFFYHGPVCLNA